MDHQVAARGILLSDLRRLSSGIGVNGEGAGIKLHVEVIRFMSHFEAYLTLSMWCTTIRLASNSDVIAEAKGEPPV